VRCRSASTACLVVAAARHGPALVVTSPAKYLVNARLSEVPQGQLALLPGTSHEGILDRVAWLASMITRFLLPSPPP
jgi:hypothetical protein